LGFIVDEMSAWISGTDVYSVLAIFEHWFSNQVRAVSFEHTGARGRAVWVAARVGPTGMSAENLCLYTL